MKSTAASTVVARGQLWNELQFPSPLYFSHWVDDTHVLVGAGGGGKRFGMANVAAVFSVDVTAGMAADSPGRPAVAEDDLWAFQCAVDLGADIPWCSSGFTKYSESEHGCLFDSSASSDSVATLGIVAISHVDSFSIVALRRDLATMALFLERIVRQSLNFDEADPDKKPIALTSGAVVVSQDDKTIAFFALCDLSTLISHSDEKSEEEKSVEKTPAPTCVIALPARVNDLAAASLPSTAAHGCGKIVVVASVQDKLLHVIVAPTNGRHGQPVDAAQLSSASMNFPKDVTFTKSALRSVFVSESGFHLLLLVNHGVSGYTYATSGKLDVAALDLIPLTSSQAPPAPSVPLIDFAPTPTRLIKDGVTCFAAIPGPLRPVAPAAAPPPRTPVTKKASPVPSSSTAFPLASSGLPENWLMGTVDGRVLLVRHSSTLPDRSAPRFAVLSQRPAAGSRKERQLHREPISSVAVSSRNDVVTTDIAQKVVISALPCASSAARPGSSAVRRKNTRLYVFAEKQQSLFLCCSLNCMVIALVLLFAAAVSAGVMSLNPSYKLRLVGALM
jgi:hypothetical protein